MNINTIWATAKPYVYGQVRHVVTLAAGALATYGVLQPTDEAKFETLATSASMWAIGAALSAGAKWYADRKVVKALNTPAPAVPATSVPVSLK